MIKASEIREDQQKRLMAEDDKQLKEIEGRIIKQSSATPSRYIYWSGYLSEHNMQKLKDAGYIVSDWSNEIDGAGCKIEW